MIRPVGGSLRDSHASLLLADGVDLATVSARLGHSSVRTTADIYSHAMRGKDHTAARCRDDIMRKARVETAKSVNQLASLHRQENGLEARP
jgi:integrase